MTAVQEKRPRCLVFETMMGAEGVGAGNGLAFGAVRNGPAVLYQLHLRSEPEALRRADYDERSG